jgi:heat shock protein HslJ
MSGQAPSTLRRNGRLAAAFALLAASASLFAACANGSTAGGSGADADPAEAIVGTWGSTATEQPHLVFDEGKVTGTDGCNAISSTYTVNGSTITVKPFMSTLRACVGVDTWLRALRTVELDGDAIIIRNAAGDQIGTLDRN